MAFDATSTYTGAIASGDTGSANLMNSLYLQTTSFAELPDVGNKGVLAYVTDSSQGRFYRDSGSSWLPVSLATSLSASGADAIDGICRKASGQYTGDGTTGQLISVNFAVAQVWIHERTTSLPAQFTGGNFLMTIDVTNDDPASGGAALDMGDSTVTLAAGLIQSLSSGFVVTDGGTNVHPNVSGIVYNYFVLG